ncbi:tetratricopeptide repeat protein [Flavobacterium sp. '19STA2R22 D10 B1']|uniref:tetratricopeptide repeat protein n=1 Tax=Flavobacterium aerium TaxID=3037261 RepID=UPI00278C0D5E|nr:tetratricopeptide repeat protein [Flavobacterium sp. '19STA2R22 D10 B1']
MRKLLLFIYLLFSVLVFGQNEQLAQNYFDKGEFEKALSSYEELIKSQPNNGVYFQKLVACYQQLQQFENAEKTIQTRLDKFKQPNLLVELGYNFQLQKKQDKAQKYYDQAIAKIEENPTYVYSVASAFESKVLLENALKTYNLAAEKNPKFNFDYQTALLYGQLGNTDMMIDKMLTYAYTYPDNSVLVQNQLARFMSEDTGDTFSTTLRKGLLVRAQKNQDIFWNQYLSWFFVQQKEYSKAFIQEKAIYKRNPESFYNIINLAQLAIEEKEEETAKEILGYILENTQNQELQIYAHYYLMSLKIEKAKEKDYKAIQTELELLIKQYGVTPYSLNLQTLQAHFLTFNMNDTEQAKTILKNASALPLNKYQLAEVKMELGDILLFEEKFNQALIYYAQIEEDLKNDEVGHEASLKVAKTSYFKGDFDWAKKQLKELKSSVSQLIANDALEIYLLINDITVEDSTQVALKKLAHADYLLYQNKNTAALQQFELILQQHKGESIEDITLLKIGRTYEKIGEYDKALSQYQKIIELYPTGIYIDEALYFSAEIYRDRNEPEKAKALYEKILFNHQDSIYFIDARIKFRQLRGDFTS